MHGWGLDFALRRCVEVSGFICFLSQYYLKDLEKKACLPAFHIPVGRRDLRDSGM